MEITTQSETHSNQPPAFREVQTTRIWSEAEVRLALCAITSDGDSARSLKATLGQMLVNGGTRTLPRVDDLSVFDGLKRTCSNFAEVIRSVRQQVTLSQDGVGYPLLRPLLLLGRPGVGKSYFAQQLASVLGTSMRHVDMATSSGSLSLSGSARHWADAAEGLIARTLIDGPHANPVFVLDEIDKASVGGKHSPISPLFTLLEPSTSRRYRDEFLQIEMNTRHIVWVMTANEAADVPEPLLSRMDVFEIDAPSAEDLQSLARSVYSETRQSAGAIHFESTVDEDVLLPLAGQPVREMRRVIERAMARSNELGRRYITRGDIDAALALGGRSPKPRIGFV